MVKLAPSILSADFGSLKEEIHKLEEGGADYLHLDVMDGSFVPNISFGPPVIKKLRGISRLPFDVHLMIDRPERYIEDFVKAGADIITIHEESTIHLDRLIDKIKSYGIKVGLALNPSTSLLKLEYVLGKIDLILIMTVNPGFGGQVFINPMKDKIKKARQMVEESGFDILVEADGGIKLDNAKEIASCGLDIIVVGSDIFNGEDIVARTRMFKKPIESWMDLNALLVLNGNEIDINKLKDLEKGTDFILCGDGGANLCLKASLIPDIIIGDLDSIHGEVLEKIIKLNIPIKKFPEKKDKTDSELALDYLIKGGYKNITIVGAIGSRMDHTLGNLLLLTKLNENKIKGKIIDNNNIIYLVDNELTLPRYEDYYISIIPITSEGIVISLAGLEYELEKEFIKFASTYGVSNNFKEERAHIKVHKGQCLLVISKD